MSAVIADDLLGPAPIAVAELEPPAQPYRGIAPFRFIDQPIFFGRMAESQRLLRLVTMFRGVLLYGDSGAGKSSLLNARFVPEAIADGYLLERIRVQPKPGAEIVVERIAVRERGMPPFLPSNLATGDETSRVVLSCDQLRERSSRVALQGYPLLIFDQFEEFLTLFEIAPRSTEERAQAAEAQERLLELLAHFLVASHTPVKLLFAFREDYFTKLQKLFVRCRDLTDQSLRLLPPSIEELTLTIRGPFEKNPGMFANPLSVGVCAQLEAELRERSSGGLQNPTEGQIAGLVLWQASERENLLGTRKVQGLLEDYLVQQLDALLPGEHASAVALLSCLVTDAGTRNIVSRSDLIARVAESESATEDAVASTLDALVQNTRLVRQEFRDRTAFYEIISEFLVPWIRNQKADRARIAAQCALEQERRESEEKLVEERREAERKLMLERAEADRRRAEDLALTLRRVRFSRAALATLLCLLLAVTSVQLTQQESAAATTIPGWSLYGRLNESGSLTERYFHNAASASAVPAAGDLIVADTFVNVRKRANAYDQGRQSWETQQIIGVISPNQRLKVAETRKVPGPAGDPMVRLWTSPLRGSTARFGAAKTYCHCHSRAALDTSAPAQKAGRPAQSLIAHRAHARPAHASVLLQGPAQPSRQHRHSVLCPLAVAHHDPAVTEIDLFDAQTETLPRKACSPLRGKYAV